MRATIDALQFADLCAGKSIRVTSCVCGEPDCVQGTELEITLGAGGFEAMEDAVRRARHRAEWGERLGIETRKAGRAGKAG